MAGSGTQRQELCCRCSRAIWIWSPAWHSHRMASWWCPHLSTVRLWDRGQLGISFLSPSVISPQPKCAREREIFVNGIWVVQGTKKVLWLPLDYRATCAAAWNDVLIMGHTS